MLCDTPCCKTKTDTSTAGQNAEHKNRESKTTRFLQQVEDHKKKTINQIIVYTFLRSITGATGSHYWEKKLIFIWIMFAINNKPGTAQVGAICKAQK